MKVYKTEKPKSKVTFSLKTQWIHIEWEWKSYLGMTSDGRLGTGPAKKTEPDFEERSVTFKIHLFANLRVGSAYW